MQKTRKLLPQEPLQKYLKILKKSANSYHTIQPLSSQMKCPNLFLKSSGTHPAQEPEDLVPGTCALNSSGLRFFFEFNLKFYTLLMCLMSSNVFRIWFRMSLTYHMQALMHKSLYSIFKAYKYVCFRSLFTDTFKRKEPHHQIRSPWIKGGGSH